MKKVQLFDQQGTVIAEVDEDTLAAIKRKQVLSDGEIMRVDLMLMDGKTVKEPPPPFHHADRRPREAPMTDAERERRQQMYADADARLSNAWRTPPATEGD